ncbi:MAG TPA: type II CAAX endopeptidase family protein [Terriglobales bacterium]|nr:type II CAAX endopeptidase family protein [Terriglobales bacterium]
MKDIFKSLSLSEMTPLRKPNPTVVFFLIAFGVPWTAWTALALMRLPRPSPWTVLLLVSGNFCSIAGFVAAYCAAGKKGIQDLLNRCLLFRVPILWWGYAISLPLLAGSITAVIRSAARGEVVTFKPLEIVHQWWVLYNFIFGFFWGPLGEEAGWRGFLLPRLLEKYSPLTASLILGLIWSLWHVPLDYRAYFHTVAGTVGFTVHTLCMSILMTVLFINTRASVLLPMILHWSNNISYEFVSVVFPGSRVAMADRVSEAVLVVLTLIIILAFRRQLTDNSLTVANLRRGANIVEVSGDYESS